MHICTIDNLNAYFLVIRYHLSFSLREQIATYLFCISRISTDGTYKICIAQSYVETSSTLIEIIFKCTMVQYQASII